MMAADYLAMCVFLLKKLGVLGARIPIPDHKALAEAWVRILRAKATKKGALLCGEQVLPQRVWPISFRIWIKHGLMAEVVAHPGCFELHLKDPQYPVEDQTFFSYQERGQSLTARIPSDFRVHVEKEPGKYLRMVSETLIPALGLVPGNNANPKRPSAETLKAGLRRFLWAGKDNPLLCILVVQRLLRSLNGKRGKRVDTLRVEYRERLRQLDFRPRSLE